MSLCVFGEVLGPSARFAGPFLPQEAHEQQLRGALTAEAPFAIVVMLEEDPICKELGFAALVYYAVSRARKYHRLLPARCLCAGDKDPPYR